MSQPIPWPLIFKGLHAMAGQLLAERGRCCVDPASEATAEEARQLGLQQRRVSLAIVNEAKQVFGLTRTVGRKSVRRKCNALCWSYKTNNLAGVRAWKARNPEPPSIVPEQPTLFPV